MGLADSTGEARGTTKIVVGVTAVVGLVAALLLVVSRYYEVRKARAEAERAENSTPQVAPPPTPRPPGGLPPLPVPPAGRPPAPEVVAPPAVERVIRFDRVVATKITGVTGGATGEQPCDVKLDRVEVVPGGRLRWHLSFTSKAAVQVLYQPDWTRSYAVDDRGTRAGVTASEFRTEGGWVVLDPRAARAGWFETDALTGSVMVTLFRQFGSADVTFSVVIPPGK